MIQVNIEVHTDGQLAGKYDIKVYDGSEKRDLLLFSNQGYENRGDAEAIARRLFGGSPSAALDTYELVDLCVKNADGTDTHEPLR